MEVFVGLPLIAAVANGLGGAKPVVVAVDIGAQVGSPGYGHSAGSSSSIK